jgi:hypothetical protein
MPTLRNSVDRHENSAPGKSFRSYGYTQPLSAVKRQYTIDSTGKKTLLYFFPLLLAKYRDRSVRLYSSIVMRL